MLHFKSLSSILAVATSMISARAFIIHKASFPIMQSSTVCHLVRCFMSSTEGSGRPFLRAKDVVIPIDRVSFQFSRSAGPGGQNVNKLNTKAEIRFHVPSADWLESETRQRLQQYQSKKISKDGELIITSQEFRTQTKNKEDCMNKLREMIVEASIKPKDRNMYEGIGEKGKAIRREEKKKRGDVKSQRKQSKNYKDSDY